jgi:hypothetical protein
VDPIQPIAPDRSVSRVELTYLSPLEREQEKQRRERERERRRRGNTPQSADETTPSNDGAEPNLGIDVRA